MPISELQGKFYTLLKLFFKEHSFAPTVTELKKWVEDSGWGKIKSRNTVIQYLQALEKAGKIYRDGGKRGIFLLESSLTVSIPLLPNPVNCGVPSNFIEEKATDHVSVSSKFISHPENTYAFRVQGNSMNNAGIDEGDIVLIEATKELKDKDLVIASIEGCGTIKRLGLNDNSITLLPESNDKSHKPIYLHPSDSFAISGKVIQILKT